MRAYQHEVEQFISKFSWAKEKRIVLYGIGRYTATILSNFSDQFCFVGLMDKDPENLGKKINGIEVIDLKFAEKNADLIIINTQEMYWNIIFRRISNSSIPVFYCNGCRANIDDAPFYENDPYWNLDAETIYKKASEYDVISFDIFDTILIRKTLLPKDVFLILEKRARDERKLSQAIARVRTEINAICINELFSFDDIYREMQKRLGLSDDDREYLMQMEMEIEKEISCPRQTIVELVNRIAKEKEIFLISDMYYPQEFIRELLNIAGVSRLIPVWISCEKKATKKQGDIWEQYREHIGEKKALHIGDNEQSDIVQTDKYGIDSILVLSPFKLWEKSSISNILPSITTQDDFCAGLLAAKLFADPFALKTTKGKVVLSDGENLGYVFFGVLIYSFIKWIINQTVMEEGRLFFFARDGYWLIKNYEFMKKLYEQNGCDVSCFSTAEYLGISRRIVLVSAIDEIDGWQQLLSFSFIGNFEYYCKSRLSFILPINDDHIHENIIMPADYEKVNGWLEPYKASILTELHKQKHDYQTYLESKHITENDYVVDLWFNGSNQLYLSKTLQKHLTGLYIVTNLSPDNICAINNTLIPAFQDDDDPLAKKSNIKKQTAFVESVLTAPYGMISFVDEAGNFVCESKMENQKRWETRENINAGIEAFMEEYIKLWDGGITPDFINDIWKEVCSKGIDITSSLKEEFYYDNVLVKMQETKVFE